MLQKGPELTQDAPADSESFKKTLDLLVFL